MRFLIAVFITSCLALWGCSGTSVGTIECSLGINCTPTPAAVPTP